MTRGAAFRGQPLLLLVGLLAAWFSLRAALWQPPLAALVEDLSAATQMSARPFAAADLAPSITVGAPALHRRAALWAWPAAPHAGLTSLPAWEATAAGPAAPAAAPGRAARLPTQVLIGHNLLLAAGLAQMELPSFLLAYLQGTPPGVPAAAPMLATLHPEAIAHPPSRWSADGWVMLRQGSAALVPGQPTYGRSQAGVVARYSLAPRSAHRPQTYLRASSALSGPREREVAAGFSARPLPGVPIRMAAEARASGTAAGTEVRPAAYAVTELPPVRLPLGGRGEIYLQGGYVGGEFATAFVDGQARAERPLARWGETELTAGGGVWGGAQKGSARLDIGPTAALAFRLGDARGRVAADYRFRVAGEAEPASGPALTVSAGF